jgi:hypothetical protein
MSGERPKKVGEKYASVPFHPGLNSRRRGETSTPNRVNCNTAYSLKCKVKLSLCLTN